MSEERYPLLRELSANRKWSLPLGKAAEHLVCFDCILNGYDAFLSDQGMSYDVVVDDGDKLHRIQVKAAAFAKERNVGATQRPRTSYRWIASRTGGAKRGQPLDRNDCDVVALVALDIGVVGYFPVEVLAPSIDLLPPKHALGTKFKTSNQWAKSIDEYPLLPALEVDLDFYKAAKRSLTHCIHGHEYTADNTYVSRHGVRGCKTCISEKSRARYLKRKARNAA